MPAIRPTIVIGLGSYGRAQVRRVLLDAHDRGTLRWDESFNSAGHGLRRIRDIEFVVVAPTANDKAEGEVVRDLCAQIQEVPETQAPAATLERVLSDCAERLLGAAQLSGTTDIGLDVIILAQPTSVAMLGNLERILQPGMELLAGSPNLHSPAAGSDLLNFLLILDFDRYWETTGAGSVFRDEMRAFVERWQTRQRTGRVSFSRVYLVDRQTASFNRNEAQRSEEVVAFLSFLLFEGQRDNPNLRSLYERENNAVDPLSAFGIRVIERNQGLIHRLAAALFAVKWIEHMSSEKGTGESREIFRRRIAGYGPAGLNFSGEREALQSAVDRQLDGFETELSDLVSQGGDGWANTVRAKLDSIFLRVRGALTAAGRHARQDALARMDDIPARLEEVVTEALGGFSGQGREPLSIAAVLEELNRLRGQLEAADPKPSPGTGAAEDRFGPLNRLHAEFREGLARQIDQRGFRSWWPRLALLCAAAWTPLVLEWIHGIPAPDPTTGWFTRLAWQLASVPAAPLLLALTIFAATWAAGALWFHRQITFRANRATTVFTHTDQGILICGLRQILRGGSLRGSVHEFADKVYLSLIRQLRSEVYRAVARIEDRLEDRRRDLEWLKIQMTEFLRTHGVQANKGTSELLANVHTSFISTNIGGERDLELVLTRNPATVDRFRSMQADIKPFNQWTEPYCDAFVYPVPFLDRLSREYKPPPATERTSRAEDELQKLRGGEFQKFLDRFPQFPVGFLWGEDPGVSAGTESYCVVHPSWRLIDEVDRALSGHGFTLQHIIPAFDPDRGFLLRVQHGISSARLTRDESHRAAREAFQS